MTNKDRKNKGIQRQRNRRQNDRKDRKDRKDKSHNEAKAIMT